MRVDTEQIALGELPERRDVAPASLEGWLRILKDVELRQATVLLALCDALEREGVDDMTGGELAQSSGLLLLHVRPRLSELHRDRLVERGDVRNSRARGEARSHPYWTVVPRQAIARWREGQK